MTPRRLRPYQQRAIDAVRAFWRQGKRSTVVVAPTGGGKTAIAEELIRLTLAAGRARAYFLAHSTELVAQPLHRLRRAGFHVGAIKSGWEADPSAPVQVASVATIVRRDIEGMAEGIALVIIDEAHHCRATQYRAILDSLHRSYRTVFLILLTATPYRLDGQELGDIADSIVELATPGDLIDAGYLLDPVCYAGPRVGEENAPRLVGDIVGTWTRLGGGLPTICRAVNRAHARSIAERFREVGVPSDTIDGTMGDDERASLMARLAVGPTHPQGIAVLTTGGTILEEGFDSAESYRHALRLFPGAPYDPLAVLIDAAPTSSRGAWIQRLGRITRPYSQAQADADGVSIVRSKARAVALVHTPNLDAHGFLRDHCGFGLRTGGAKGPRGGVSMPQPLVCPACMAVSPPSARVCVGCDRPIVRGAADLPREAEAVLTERRWEPPLRGTDEAAELRTLRRIVAKKTAIDRDRTAQGKPPYKDGWIGAQFRMMHGRWPEGDLLRKALDGG